MAWLAISPKGQERIFRNKPTFDWLEWLDEEEFYVEGQTFETSTKINLPSGTIEKILGRPLSFEESPIEI